jgi:peptide/nickel transport system permease protein
MPFMVFIVLAVILFNLLADVSYAWLDPRIRLD